MDGWIEVFKAGKYPQGDVTVDDLKAAEKNYDPKYFESPITLDHSETGPVYGKVEKIKVGEKGSLWAKFRNVSSDLIDMVKTGKYTERSAEFYPNLDGKGFYLRAVSFVPFPQVKGMTPITFSENERINFPAGDYLKFEEYRMPYVSRVFQNIRDFFIEKFGLEVADKCIPSYTIDTLREPAENETPQLYSEKNKKENKREDEVTPEEFMKFREDSEKENTALKKELQKYKESARESEALKFFEGLVENGIEPKHKDTVVGFMAGLSDEKTGNEKSQVERFQEIVSVIAPQKKSRAGDGLKYGEGKAKTSADLESVDSDDDGALFGKIEKYSESKGISFSEAYEAYIAGKVND